MPPSCRPYIKEYLDAPNKMLLGQRTVVIMSASVGQKSYGSERRFLVPPPSAYILGCSWWTHLPDAFVEPRNLKTYKQPDPAVQLFAPTMNVSLRHDPGAASEPSTEWTTFSGQSVQQIASADDFPVAGRAVGKQLFIPDAKEARDEDRGGVVTKSSVEAAITVISPGLGPERERTIGTFISKPIKVISKPSKKSQNSKKGTRECKRQWSTGVSSYTDADLRPPNAS